MDKRRHESGMRRVDKALQYFFDKSIIQPTTTQYSRVVNRSTRKCSTEIQKYFVYKGEEVRFDYSIQWEKPLPKITEIRQVIWESLNGYRLSLQK